MEQYQYTSKLSKLVFIIAEACDHCQLPFEMVPLCIRTKCIDLQCWTMTKREWNLLQNAERPLDFMKKCVKLCSNKLWASAQLFMSVMHMGHEMYFEQMNSLRICRHHVICQTYPHQKTCATRAAPRFLETIISPRTAWEFLPQRAETQKPHKTTRSSVMDPFIHSKEMQEIYENTSRQHT